MNLTCSAVFGSGAGGAAAGGVAVAVGAGSFAPEPRRGAIGALVTFLEPQNGHSTLRALAWAENAALSLNHASNTWPSLHFRSKTIMPSYLALVERDC